MDALNQNSTVINGNIQEGIVQQQFDPDLKINTNYLPNGDLSLTSDLSYGTNTIKNISIPLSAVTTIFRPAFDSSEVNLVNGDVFVLNQKRYTPHHQIQMPNIARYIGYVMTGVPLYVKYLESIMLCCRNYLDGTMEILPSGAFMYLNQRRDGTVRRYSDLCIAIYYAIASDIYSQQPGKDVVDMELQSLIQNTFLSNATSMYVEVIPYVVNNTTYNVTKPLIKTWATSSPWHALIYNSQAPLSMDEYVKLFLKVFAIFTGKAIRYLDDTPNVIKNQAIIPNSPHFTKLSPPGTSSHTIQYDNSIITRMYKLVRYIYAAEQGLLEWEIEVDELDDENNDVEVEDELFEEDDSILS